MCQGIIYRATNLINGKCYIGQTTRKLKVRKERHLKDSLNVLENNYFHKAIKKYGFENFTWEVIYECEPIILDMMETFKIMVNHAHWTEGGYNLTWGGKTAYGYKHTEEAKKKISVAKSNPSNETRRKLSEAGKRRQHTKETIEKMKIVHKGVKHTEEAKKKMSIANKGKKRTEEQIKRMSLCKKGIILSQSHREKISNSLKGHKVSIETRKKIGEGHKNPSKETRERLSKNMKGKHHTEEAKKKMSMSHQKYTNDIILQIIELKEKGYSYSNIIKALNVNRYAAIRYGKKCKKI